jgi:hypothetical protein
MTRQRNHELKLDRARNHLQALEYESDAWLDSKPYRLTEEPGTRRYEKVLFAELLQPVPSRLAPIIGDCVHNLRSALDNLAYELAIAYTGEPLPTNIEKSSGFPILFRDNEGSKKRVNHMIRGMHPEAQAIIRRLQPHRPTDNASPADPLWLLNELSNKDKHRFPHLGFFNTTGISVSGAPPIGGSPRVRINPGVVEDRREIARYYPRPGERVWVDLEYSSATFVVAFGKGAADALYGSGVHNILRIFLEYITDEILPDFDRFLP